MDQKAPSFSLRPISATELGAPVKAVTLPKDRPFLVGRSAEADWSIPDQSVSRRHASFLYEGERWMVTDLTSRHGTSVNDRRIEPGVPTPIHDGDTITFGSWRSRAMFGSLAQSMMTSFTPAVGHEASVNAIPTQQLGGIAQRGLEVLMDLTGKLHTLTDRESVASAAIEALQRATGCRRVLIVEPSNETEFTILASSSDETPRISRTLIDQAARQGLVELRVKAGSANQAQSIVDLGIRSAICAPIRVDGAPAAFVTIDTREAEGVVPKDAAAFCQSVAQLVGLTFGRIAASTMAERHRQLQYDLDAARRVQQLLSPPGRGTLGPVSYHFESIPGRVVAGDLFDIFPLDRSRVAFFLGDVCGKGVGAAMLMAACQSLLRSHLLSGADLRSAMSTLNTDLHARTEDSKFITLFAGIIDAEAGNAQLVDAGHGLCVSITPGHPPTRIETPGGLPIGVVDATEYDLLQLALPVGTKLVLFSDGAVEQTNPAGRQYGLDRVLESLQSATEDGQLVERLVEDINRYAQGPLADDLTVARLSTE